MQGLPPSRLVSLKGPEARSSKEESNCGQGDCAGPMLLKEEKVEVVVKEEKIEMEETREKESCQSVGASAGGSTHFTPRSTHAGVILPSPQPLPCFLPFPNLCTPCFPPQTYLSMYLHQLARCRDPFGCCAGHASHNSEDVCFLFASVLC